MSTSNGNLVGEHKGGYSAFGWDVSSLLTIGADNVIAVKVTNANDANVAPNAGDYTMDGGIYRHVNLIATNPQHVALQEFVPADTSANPVGPTVSYFLNTPGVYLTQTNVASSSANLSITTDVRNDATTAKTLSVVSDNRRRGGKSREGAEFFAIGRRELECELHSKHGPEQSAFVERRE